MRTEDLVNFIRKETECSLFEAVRILRKCAGPQQFLCTLNAVDHNATLTFDNGDPYRVRAERA